jgi:hypothetical protein
MLATRHRKDGTLELYDSGASAPQPALGCIYPGRWAMLVAELPGGERIETGTTLMGLALAQVAARLTPAAKRQPDPEDPCRGDPRCLETGRCPYDPVCNN